MVVPYDNQKSFKQNVVLNVLPGFSSWLNKHKLMDKPIHSMSSEEISKLYAKFLEMHRREFDKLNDEIPF